MPRKTKTKAEREAQIADCNRWRLLVRNPGFLEELRRLRKLALGGGYRARFRVRFVKKRRRGWFFVDPVGLLGAGVREYRRVIEKWGLRRLQLAAIFLPDADDLDPQSLEEYYRAGGGQIDFPPVEVGPPVKGRLLPLTVDLACPVDITLPVIEAALRRLRRGRPTKRGRPGSLDFQLAVFDQVKLEGQDFRTVARRLGKPISTVRSAYLAACRKVGVAGVPPAKRRAPPNDPGPCDKCPNPGCRSAQRPEEFCPAHRAWVEQDRVPLREYLPPRRASD